MSFTFSQNLLSDITSSQSSQSDTLPPTQPMIMPNRSINSTRQNMTFPRPPSCPDLSRPVSSSYQRAKYSRQENSSNRQASLGITLREVQTRLNSVPSTFSRMLEEALVFLEAMITKEEETTSESVKTLRNILEKTVEEFSAVKTKEEEVYKKASTSVEIVKSLTKALVAVDAGQNNTARVVEIIEKKLDKQVQFNIELMKDVSRLKDDIPNGEMRNLAEIVRETVRVELERIKRKSILDSSTSRVGGASANWLGRAVGPFGGVNSSTVRGFSLATGQGEQVQAMVDFSLVMEMDDEEEEEEDMLDYCEE